MVHTEPEISDIIRAAGSDITIGLAHKRIEENLGVGDRCNTSVGGDVAASNSIGGPADFTGIESLPSSSHEIWLLGNLIISNPRESVSIYAV